jgi:predicted alpha/beta hydrolase
LPKGVFLQWAHWVNSPRYVLDDPSVTGLANFPKFEGAMRAMSMADDPWATRTAVERLCAAYTSAKPELLVVTPAELGVPKIGHFGFFRPEHRDTLWRGAAEWLEG